LRTNPAESSPHRFIISGEPKKSTTLPIQAGEVVVRKIEVEGVSR
jgi:hypothetical protein